MNNSNVQRRARRALASVAAFAAASAFLILAFDDSSPDTAVSAANTAQTLRALAKAEQPISSSSIDGGAAPSSPSGGKKSSGDSDPLEDVVVKMYVKGSGNGKYLGHSRVIADTWGRDLVELTGGRSTLTFLMDNANYDAVEDLGGGASKRPRGMYVRHVDGTDQQGDYRGRDGAGQVVRDRAQRIKMRDAAFKAQRTKLRAVFEDAFDKGKEEEKEKNAEDGNNSDGKFDWVCYMDDDVIVNVPVLFAELRDVRDNEDCSPNCWIADRILFRGERPYTAGGWCMERTAASRIHDLFAEHGTDGEMGWNGNDDVSFVGLLKENEVYTKGLVPMNSERWYCHNSRPVIVAAGNDDKEEGGEKVKKASMDVVSGSPWYDLEKYPRLELDYESNGGREFVDGWLPTLSVFHNRVGYDAYGIMTGKLSKKAEAKAKAG